MASLKEMRVLKEEEKTLVQIATKLSDQLNRLKVEELALVNMLRMQEDGNEASGGVAEEDGKEEEMDSEPQPSGSTGKLENIDLSVPQAGQTMHQEEDEEEEEEDEEEGEVDSEHNQLTAFINELDG